MTEIDTRGIGRWKALAGPGLPRGGVEPVRNRLRLSSRRRGDGVVVVEPVGEVDLATAPTLRASLEGIQIPESGLLVLLDLSRLDFCDAAGLGVMVVSARRLAEHGARLALVAPQRYFTRLLEIAQLDGYFEVFPSLLAAEESLTAR